MRSVHGFGELQIWRKPVVRTTNRELDGHQGRLLLRRDCRQILQRPAERLLRSGELHVGLRDFDDYIPIGDIKCRLKLDLNLEIWTVLTDKSFS